MELEYISLSFNSSLLIKCYSLSGLLVKGEWKCRHDSLTFYLALVFDTLFLPLIKSLMVSVPFFSFGFRINKIVAFQNSCVTLVLVFIFLPLLWRSSLPIVFFLSYWCWFFLCWSPAAFVFEIDVVAPSFFPLIFFFLIEVFPCLQDIELHKMQDWMTLLEGLHTQCFVWVLLLSNPSTLIIIVLYL